MYNRGKVNDMPHFIEVVERIMVPDPPQIELPSEDGFPLESNWHRLQINQLVDSIRQHWRGQTNLFAGGNMFLYYSTRQVRDRDYKGPDVFVVKNVDAKDRRAWIVWEEDGRFPDVIVELLSPTTAAADLGSKKDLYEQRFKTPEYYCYDPETRNLQGWRLGQHLTYEPLQPNEHGRMLSEQLGAWLGLWEGEYQHIQATWVRLFEDDGQMVPTSEEAERRRADAEHQRAETERQRAETERQRAETERQRAETAEEEVARLREELERLKGPTQ
jgi:Uma2 family endonuclease